MWDAFSGGFFELIHPSHLKALMSNWSWLQQNIQVQFMGDLSLSEKNKKQHRNTHSQNAKSVSLA